jgi:hypothetical protein
MATRNTNSPISTNSNTSGTQLNRRHLEPPPEAGDAWEPPSDNADIHDPASPTTPGISADLAVDPFDPRNLRVLSDFSAAVGVKKALLTIQPRKPDKSWWVRAHPDPAFRLQTVVVELKGERGGSEVYLIAPQLRAALAAEPTLRPKLFVTAVTTQGIAFLWDINLPREDRTDNWSRTALAAVELATHAWVRVAANMSSGGYDVWEATGTLPDPQWPDLPLRELLRLAFKDHYIDSTEHPVLRRLRGEVG